mgnify:CR=1 FL=1
MIKISNLLFVSLLLALVTAGQAQKHSNVDYLSFGYDIFRGNPHSTQGVDPGFRFERIFDLTYDQKLKSIDGNWDIPDKITMARTDACSLNFESTQLDSMVSYQKSLEVEVSVSAEFFGASFKASTAYKSMEKSMTTTSEKHISSKAICNVYKAKISAYDPPKLHEQFIKAVQTLPTNYDEKQYFKFIDNYGTHAITEINMGARFGMISSISKSSYEKFQSEGISVSVAASFSALGFSGGVDTRTNTQKEWANKYNSAMTNYQIISVGAKPVGNHDAVAWAQQAITQPMPLRYTLIPLHEILDPLYVRGSLETSRMNGIRTNLQTALKNYCSNSLRPQGLVSDCNRPSDPKPEPPKPPKINSCKWCATSCGGDFPVDGGHTSADRNWPSWAYTFSQRCEGSYRNNEFQNGIHLCCQNVDSNRKGQCRICNSCGGDFPEAVGAIQYCDRDEKFTSAYDNNCLGDSRTRLPPEGGLKVCCQQDPICSMCSSCGGQWPHESGVLGADQNWIDFFRGRGHGCSGAVGRNDALRGMKWCCKTQGTSRWQNFLDLEENETASI